MNKVFEYAAGSLPVLISMPHNGSAIPDDIAGNMQPNAVKSMDTDWYLDRLYDFASELGCSVISPIYSRYVIDLNRPSDNQSLYPGSDTTGLCPINQFDHQSIYKSDYELSDDEIERRVNTYWLPYHQKLRSIIEDFHSRFGFCLLFEAHSIKSVVPRFFEGQLPDFNFGDYELKTTSVELQKLISEWQPHGYSKVYNGRFKGGHITREYGKPENNIESLQLELSQATYMDEARLDYDQEKANKVKIELRNLIQLLVDYTQGKISNR